MDRTSSTLQASRTAVTSSDYSIFDLLYLVHTYVAVLDGTGSVTSRRTVEVTNVSGLAMKYGLVPVPRKAVVEGSLLSCN